MEPPELPSLDDLANTVPDNSPFPPTQQTAPPGPSPSHAASTTLPQLHQSHQHAEGGILSMSSPETPPPGYMTDEGDPNSPPPPQGANPGGSSFNSNHHHSRSLDTPSPMNNSPQNQTLEAEPGRSLLGRMRNSSMDKNRVHCH